jgi:hypothetical protein
MAVVFLAIAPLAAAMALSDDPADPRAVVVYLTSPAVVCLGALVVQTRVRLRRQDTGRIRLSTPPESSAPGLVIPYRRDVAVLWVLIGGYACALGVALLLIGLVAVTTRGTAGLPLLFAGLALATATAPALFAVARGRLRRGVLVLTPERIIHRSWAFDISGAWDQVVAVTPAGGDRPTVLVTMMRMHQTGVSSEGATVRTRTAPTAAARLAPHIAIEATSVHLDPVLLLETLRFYAAHADARSELGTARAVARVRRGDVLR